DVVRIVCLFGCPIAEGTAEAVHCCAATHALEHLPQSRLAHFPSCAARENVLANTWQAGEQFDRPGGQRHAVRLAALGALAWNRPDVAVNLAPPRAQQ